MFHREKISSIYLLQVSGDENVGKKNCLFFHCGIMCLKLILTLKWKEMSFKISLSIPLRECVGIGGLFWWNVSYVLHTEERGLQKTF